MALVASQSIPLQSVVDIHSCWQAATDVVPLARLPYVRLFGISNHVQVTAGEKCYNLCFHYATALYLPFVWETCFRAIVAIVQLVV